MRFSALVRFSTRTSSHAIKRYNVTVTIEFLLDYGFALMQTVDYAMQTLIQPKTVWFVTFVNYKTFFSLAYLLTVFGCQLRKDEAS